MCGRFVSSSSPEKIAEYFGAESNVESLGQNFNVAPTNDIYGVVETLDGNLELQVFHWGLIPVWAKDRKIGQKMINARSETIAEKAAFKGDFKKHRCIIPMDGFFEWKAGEPGGPVTKAGKPAKQPMFTLEERLAMLKEATVGMASVEIDAFSGLLVDYARRREVTAIVKGLRAVSDFDYELQMAQMNYRLAGVDTMFMTTNPTWSYLSSSLVKDVARHGGDVTGLVPDFVVTRLRERTAQPPA